MNKSEVIAAISTVRSELQSALADIEKRGLDSENVQEAAEGMQLSAAVALMADLRELNDLADSVKKQIGKAYDHMRVQVIPERMDDEGMASMKVQGVGTVKLTADMHMSVKDKEGMHRWLEEHGLDGLIQEQVNAQQLKSVLRKMMEEGEEVPNDLVKISPFTRASITK